MTGIKWTANIPNYQVAIVKADRNAKTAMRNGLRRMAAYHVRRLDQIVANWKHNVEFSSGTTLRVSEQIIGIRIETKDAIFGFLDRGTSKRTRRMNPDYMPKSSYQYFGTEGVGGYVVGVGKMPGIQARSWFEFIERDLDRSMFDTMSEILNDFSREANDW